MHRKCLSLLFFFLILVHYVDQNNFVNCAKKVYNKPNKSTVRKVVKPMKSSYASLQSSGVGLVSASNLDQLMVPIKKLTRRRIIKLLIKTIKRVNKNAKKLNKSDNKSIEFRPTIGQAAKKLLGEEYTNSKFENTKQQQQQQQQKMKKKDSQFNYPKIDDQRATASSNQINFEIRTKRPLSGANLSLFNGNTLDNQKKIEQFGSPSAHSSSVRTVDKQRVEAEKNLMLHLESINNHQLTEQQQVPVLAHLTNTDLLVNTQLDDQILKSALHHLYNQIMNDQQASAALDSIYLDKSASIGKQHAHKQNALKDNRNQVHTRTAFTNQLSRPIERPNENQIFRMNIPFNEIIHYPVFVSEQLNSTSNQNEIRNFANSQLDRINTRSDNFKKEAITNRLVNLIAKQLEIDTDRNDDQASITATKLLGAFVGDVVGVLIEEILHQRGDKIADGIRTRIGDVITNVIDKSNLTLETAFRNLSKLMIKQKRL